MAIFPNAERDAADLAKLVNENGYVTTRYGDNPKRTWQQLQDDFDTTEAGGFVAQSVAAADRAETAADAAALSGNIYDDTASGIAATVSGDYFSVDSPDTDNYLDLYKNVSGVAEFKKSYPSSEYVGTYITRNKRILSLEQRTGFVDSEYDKAVLATDLTTTPTLPLSVISNDLIVDGTQTNVTESLAIHLGHVWTGDRKLEVELETKIEASDPTTNELGVYIGFGSTVQDFRFAYYRSNGRIGICDALGNDVSFLKLSPELSYSKGEFAKIKVESNPDGKGVLTATAPNGTIVTCPFYGLPKGKVWVGLKEAANTVCRGFNVTEYIDKIEKTDNFVNGDFKINQFTGMFTGFNDLTSSLYKYNTTDGNINITATGSQAMMMFDMLTVREQSQAYELSTSGKLLTGSEGNGCIIGIGDSSDVSANRRFYAYLSNGYVGVFNNDNGFATAGDFYPELEFNLGETATIELYVKSDNSGFIRAIAPNGNYLDVPVTDVPSGKVWIGWRNTNTGTISKFTARPLSFTTENQQEKIEFISENINSINKKLPDTNKPTLLRAINIADSVPDRDPFGFTCTGLDKLTRGKWAGCWLVGDDGRLVALDGTPTIPAVHVLTPDFSRILFTINGNYNDSLQGVTVDTLTTEETIWVATASLGQVRHYEIYGANAGQEILADRITLSSLGLTANVSALAFDPDSGTGKGALWTAPPTGSNTANLIDCDPNAVTRIIKSITLTVIPDQFHYDSVNKHLYYSQGANGTNGYVRMYNLNDDTDVLVYDNLELAQAMEGIYIDKLNKKLTVMSDGGFHFEAEPSLNLALEYGIPI